ncbi:sel1 repeat family protein [Ahniella affigens]|nr:sel1 repeat family protein [Ahniella affigens]
MKRLIQGMMVASLLTVMGTAAAGSSKDKIESVPHQMAGSEAFLRYHPDLRWRREGVKSFDEGRFDDALAQLKRAAKYGDKPSQGLIAEMYWKGNGVETDRALAYAWMDLAAQRNYKSFTAMRELYWSKLTPDEQKRAINVGTEIYAEYGDDVALPRMTSVLRKAKRDVTGSRVGFVGNLDMQVRAENGEFAKIKGEDFYKDQFWEPELYVQWKDEFFENPFGGTVDVGELRREEESKTAAAEGKN